MRRGVGGNSLITNLISPGLGRWLIRLLDAVTEEGFVFRVDMRLRPYGDSGALVGSFSALELYYQEQGQGVGALRHDQSATRHGLRRGREVPHVPC